MGKAVPSGLYGLDLGSPAVPEIWKPRAIRMACRSSDHVMFLALPLQSQRPCLKIWRGLEQSLQGAWLAAPVCGPRCHSIASALSFLDCASAANGAELQHEILKSVHFSPGDCMHALFRGFLRPLVAGSPCDERGVCRAKAVDSS